ncbi:MAG: DUF4249 domain-containing protein [Mucilaginibacter sp.]
MRHWKIYLAILLLGLACRKPYNPHVINSPKSYLVVEGVINTNDTTTIKLSRTVNLSAHVTSNPVDGVVSVESDAGESYELTPTGGGVYKLINTTLSNSHKYRLYIRTADNGNEYRSDFAAVKNSPPIDSVGFKITSKGIQLYLNAHDNADATRYYRFDYWETWRFHSQYASGWKSNGVDDVVVRPFDEQIYYCFQSDRSSSIILGSTAKLKQDVLYQLPITEIESTSEKIETKYSIQVRQYALTPEAYKFWENLKKNTEQLGSIFDAEPTQLAGNIHNIKDNTDVVIGYISVGSVAVKRVFIANDQLPADWLPAYPYDCLLDSAWYSHPKTKVNDVRVKLVPGIEIPVTSYGKGIKPDGYTAADKQCVDCTIRGTTKQPDFWK